MTPVLVVVVQKRGQNADEAARSERRLLATILARAGSRAVHRVELGGTLVLSDGKEAPSSGRTSLTSPAERPSNLLRPPAAVVDIDEDSVTIETDPVGFKHVYTTETRHHFAASTSSSVLGAFAGAALDEVAVAQLATLGFLLGARSLFEGVRLVEQGAVVRLAAGSMHVSRRSARELSSTSNGPVAIRRSVADLLTEDPSAVLELSGGLDSRLILGAMTPEERAGRVALTIDGADGSDARIARMLARREGLQHVVISGQPWSGRDPIEVRRRVERAALVREFSANALAGATLDAIEDQAPGGARLTGVNGEYARGFYHPGTLPRSRVTPASVRRLLRWRMATNERVSDSLLLPEWRSDQLEGLVQLLTEDLLARSLPLRPALDEFYLHGRVRRWAGPSYSHASTQRRVLAPFLHPAFLRWAASTGLRERAGSRAMARVLCELDPDLGRLPLASGRTPSQIGGAGPSARIAALGYLGGKVARKVGQRVRASRRPPGGAEEVLKSLAQTWSSSGAFDELSRLAFLRDQQLDQWSEQPLSVDSSSASFLINLSGSLQLLAVADAAERSWRGPAELPAVEPE